VQSVESGALTKGYKSKLPLFHKLFLSGVEKVGGTNGDWVAVRLEVIGPSGRRVSGYRKFKIQIQKRSSFGTQMTRSLDGPITR
jgi:hypothetical protein